MTKISKRTAILLVAVLALGTFSVGTALAKRSSGGIKPTLSLRAYADQGSKMISGSGTYNNVSSLCKGPGGRQVALFVNGKVKASAVTGSSGGYSASAGPFKKGRFKVRSLVRGQVSGGYGYGTVCHDAWSNVVKVKIGKHHHKKH